MGKTGHNRADITFGIILVGIGGLFLLQSFDIIGFNIWNLLIRSWPLFLILIGLNILLRETKFWWITPLLLIILFGSLFFPNPRNPVYWNLIGRPGRQVENQTETLGAQMMYDPDIEFMDVELRVDAGRIDISSLPEQPEDGEEKLYDLSFEYREEEPNINYEFDRSEGVGLLTVDQRQQFQLEKVDIINRASLMLNSAVPYNLNIESGAGHYELDLNDLKVDFMEINAGVSDLSIYFNNHSSEFHLSSGASNMDFHFPSEVGIKIDTENVVSSDNFTEVGLEEVDSNTFQSEDFAQKDEQIYIKISSPASNIKVNID